MKTLLAAAIIAVISTPAFAFPDSLVCSANDESDGAIKVTVKKESVELEMHEMSFAPIDRKENHSEDANTLAFDVKNTSVSAEGDDYTTDLELNLTYNTATKKLSMALNLTNKDLGIGTGGGFLTCK